MGTLPTNTNIAGTETLHSITFHKQPIIHGSAAQEKELNNPQSHSGELLTGVVHTVTRCTTTALMHWRCGVSIQWAEAGGAGCVANG